MKKIYLCTLPLLFLFLSVKSQSPTFKLTYDGNGLQVQNNTQFYTDVPASNAVTHSFKIKNISTVTQTVNITKFDDIIHVIVPNTDYAEAYFCTGINCFPSTTTTGIVVLAQDEEIIFLADFVEASAVAKSAVRYKFENAANANDNLMMGLTYNDPTAVSVKSKSSVFSGVSDVYPNPSSSKSFLNINSATGIDGVNLTVINSLGATLISKQIDVASGKNTISIDSENFANGIYFVSLNNGTSTITKKITIIK